MAQETSHTSPGFGRNTNGLGIVIIAVVLVVFALVGWNFWNKATAEQNWYRFENTNSGHAGHGAGHGAGHEAAAPAATADTTKPAASLPAADTSAAKPAHDSTGGAH
ncbi:MAG: hypothetical protein MUF62_14085 [Chitinophagaceae bacterium]|nr:hypothetical protein [Chitinophagaceae bacterium]